MGDVISKFVVNARFLVAFCLAAFDFISHKNFHDLYIIDEGELSDSFLKDGGKIIHTDADRQRSTIRIQYFQFIVLDTIRSMYDKQSKSLKQQFFIEIWNGGQKLQTIEKTYDDMRAFALSLEYSLKGRDISCPKLESNNRDLLLPSSDEIFR